MAKGDIVLIRASAGQPGVRRLWNDQGERPFVCHEEYWGRWERQGIEPVCWPVAREQILQFDAQLAGQLEAAFREARGGDAGAAARLDSLWKEARPYAS